MHPIEALDEIAYWLERELASPYKIKAFRGAAVALRALTDDEFAERSAAGRWTGIKGVGGTSIEVIEQAVAGEIPEYLVAARERGAQPLVSSGGELRAQLRGDLHSHSDWSDGTTPIRSMADAARALGHEYLVLTDHSPHLTVANGLSADRLKRQLSEVAEVNAGLEGFDLLSGIEVDILSDGALDQEPHLLARLDVVVASIHSDLKAARAEMTARMIAAIENPQTNVLGHCTGRLVQGPRGTRPQSQFDAEAVFAACVANDVAVEINSRPERQDPPDDLIAVALAAGCLFSIDSDAHAPGHLALIDYGAARASAAGIPADRIVTTWPVDRLRAWAES